MPRYDRPRTDSIASHVYTLPVVREVPIGSPADSDVPPVTSQPVVYAADAHAW
jgi:hypothetical protein